MRSGDLTVNCNCLLFPKICAECLSSLTLFLLSLMILKADKGQINLGTELQIAVSFYFSGCLFKSQHRDSDILTSLRVCRLAVSNERGVKCDLGIVYQINRPIKSLNY